MNAIGTQLRGLINSGLTRLRLTVWIDDRRRYGHDQEGEEPVSKHQIQAGFVELED